MTEKKEIPFGVDFGSWNICGAVWWNEKVEVVANELGSRTTPSYYYYDGNESFVGKTAKDKTDTNPKNVYYDSKRLIAQKFDNPLIEKFKSEWTFELNRADRNLCEYIVNDKIKPLSPIYVAGAIIKYIKELAIINKQQCGGNTEIKKAVITVPAYFTTKQRNAIQEAAKYANLDIIRILTEPIAAAIACGIGQDKYTDGENLFIFHLGYNTFDVTIITFNKGCYETLVVRDEICLGGIDFDRLIFEWMKQKLEIELIHFENLKDKKKYKMMIQARAIKEALSVSQETPVNLSDIFETAKSHILTRKEFEEMSKNLLKKLETECQAALQAKNLKGKDIDHVLFVGGSSRMPMVARMLKNIFLDDTKFSKIVNPDEVVAVGAAMYAAACLKATNKPEILKLVNQVTDEIQDDDALFELAVAIHSDFNHDCYSWIIVEKGSKMKRRYFTTKDDQTSASIIICEGKQKIQEILSFEILNLPQGHAGEVYVDVTFEINENNILKVTAKSRTSLIIKRFDTNIFKQRRERSKKLYQEETAIEKTEDQKLLEKARLKLQNNVESIKIRCQKDKRAPEKRKQLIIGECDEVIKWLNEHPDEHIDEHITNLEKQIQTHWRILYVQRNYFKPQL